jgi:hypothetical protein
MSGVPYPRSLHHFLDLVEVAPVGIVRIVGLLI